MDVDAPSIGQPARFALRGSEPVIRLTGGRSIAFHGHQRGRDERSHRISSATAGASCTVEEPAGDNRLASLLMLELQIWGHDPLREQYLARARHWLKEILFL